MNKYRVTVSVTSYHHMEIVCENEDEAENQAIKKFQWDTSKPTGDTEYEVVEIEEIEAQINFT